MTQLADWLQEQMEQRGLTQIQTAVQTGIAQGTISDILKQGHIPRPDTLFRLADHFSIPRVDILILAGHLTPADRLPRTADLDPLDAQLLHEFHRLPDPWKPHAIDQLRLFARLATRHTDHVPEVAHS